MIETIFSVLAPLNALLASSGSWPYIVAYPLGMAGAILVGHLAASLIAHWLRSQSRHLRILTADGVGWDWTVRNSTGASRRADSGGWILDAPAWWLKAGTRLWVDLGDVPIEEVEIDLGPDGHLRTIRLSVHSEDLPRATRRSGARGRG